MTEFIEAHNPSLSKYALRSPLMRLSAKNRSRSISSPKRRQHSRPMVLGSSVSDPGTRTSRCSSEEEEDFKFLDKVVEELNLKMKSTKLEADPVSPPAEPIQKESQESQNLGNREEKIKLFSNLLSVSSPRCLRKLSVKSPRSYRKLVPINSSPEATSDGSSFKSGSLESSTPFLSKELDTQKNSLSTRLNLSPVDFETRETSLIDSNEQLHLADAELIKKNLQKLEKLAKEFQFLNNNIGSKLEEEHKTVNYYLQLFLENKPHFYYYKMSYN